MKEYDAYLFDADGTLIDTKELIYQSFLRMGEAVNVSMPPKEKLVSTIGLPVWTQTVMFLGEGREDAYYHEAIGAYSDFMRSAFPDYLALFPGVREGLARLADAGKRLAIVTSRRRDSMDPFIDYLDLGKYFSAIVCTDDTERHKPDPQPALFALERLGARAEQSVFVGDASFDMGCGKGAGMDVALIDWDGVAYSAWEVQPDYIATRFEQLLPGGLCDA